MGRRRFAPLLISFVVTAALLPVIAARADEIPAPAYPGGSYHTLDGGRLLDTRSGLGGTMGSLRSATVTVAGHRGVPSSGVSGVIVNFKVVDPVAAGTGVAKSNDIGSDGTRSLSFGPHQTVAQTNIVPLGPTGLITLRTTHSAYLILDVLGYFTDPAHAAGGGLMHTTTGGRVLAGASMPPRSSRTVRVTGGSVPADAVAVIANVTASSPSATGALTVYGTGRPKPEPALNFVRGEGRSNRVIVPVGRGGTVTLANGAGSVRAYVDVTGYFVRRTGGAYYLPGFGNRVFNSADPGGVITAPHRRLPVDGFMPTLGRALARPIAVIGSVTANPRGGDRAGYVVTYAAGDPRPRTVDVTYPPRSRAAVGNLLVTRLGGVADIGLDNPADNASEIVDVAGAFVLPAPNPTPSGVFGYGSGSTGGRVPSASAVSGPPEVRQLAGNLSSVTVLRGDRTVETWDNTVTDPPERTIHTRSPVAGLDQVSAVDRTLSTSFALRGGTVYSWGSNANGILGTGATASTTTPTAITDLPAGIKGLGTGYFNGYAFTETGELYGWGDNANHQLADGTTTDRSTPVRIDVPGTVVSVSGTSNYQYAATADGKLYRWGGGFPSPTELAQPCLVRSVLASSITYAVLCTDSGVAVGGRTISGSGRYDAIGRTAFNSVFSFRREDGTVWRSTSTDLVQVPDLSAIDVIGYSGAWEAAIRNPG